MNRGFLEGDEDEDEDESEISIAAIKKQYKQNRKGICYYYILYV